MPLHFVSRIYCSARKLTQEDEICNSQLVDVASLISLAQDPGFRTIQCYFSFNRFEVLQLSFKSDLFGFRRFTAFKWFFQFFVFSSLVVIPFSLMEIARLSRVEIELRIKLQTLHIKVTLIQPLITICHFNNCENYCVPNNIGSQKIELKCCALASKRTQKQNASTLGGHKPRALGQPLTSQAQICNLLQIWGPKDQKESTKPRASVILGF